MLKVTLDKLTLYPARQYVVPEEKHALPLSISNRNWKSDLPDLASA